MNAKELSNRMAGEAATIAEYLLPKGKKASGEWKAGSVSGEAGQSLSVRLTGAKAGTWKDFAAGHGGDLLDLWMAVRSCSLADAMTEAKSYLGIRDTMPQKPAKVYPRPAKPTKTAIPVGAVREWLNGRGIDDMTIEAFKVREVQRNGKTWALFPYLRDGEYINAKYRDPSDKKAMGQEKDAEPCLFGWHLIQPQERRIVIAEGECFPGSAEIMTPSGWVPLADYTGGVVAQFRDGAIEWVDPIAKVQKHYTGDLLRYETRGYVSVTTPGHNLVSLDVRGRFYKHTAEDGPVSVSNLIPRVGLLDGTGIALSDAQIKLCIAISADASIDARKQSYAGGAARNLAHEDRYARFGFKRQRKIDRLRSLLRELGINASDTAVANGYQSVCFPLPDWVPGRILPWQWIAEASASQREMILAEMVHWDGNSVPNRNQTEYSTKYRENADFVQALAHTTGRVSTIIQRRNEFGEWLKVSILHGKKHTSWQSLKGRASCVPHDGPVYCVQVPSGAILVRQEGKITVSGNCDAMTLWQAGLPAVSVNAGAGNHQWIESDWLKLERFSEIIVAFDHDEAGDKGAAEVIKRLGVERCKRMQMGAKDANEWLTNGATAEDFVKAAETAKSVDPEELRQASDFMDRVKALFYPVAGADTDPFLRLDKDLEWFNFRSGEVTVWTGYNGHGKSLMLSQVLLGLMQQGERVVVFSGEMTAERQMKRMVKQATGLDRPTTDYIDAVGGWVHDKLWIFNVVGSADLDRLLSVFLYANKRYGTRHFVIDSLMMTDVPEDGAGAMTAQKEAMRKLCNFARREGCHVHLVAHPRKGSDESRGPGKLDVAGSSKITDGADNVFTVWSARKDENDPDVDWDSPDASLELQKARNGDVQHFKQHLWFCKPAQQFTSNSRRRPVSYVDFSRDSQEYAEARNA